MIQLNGVWLKTLFAAREIEIRFTKLMKTVITYGTFDIFHVGHLRILERLAAMGDRLIVGVSTDEFNLKKGKSALLSYTDRSAVVGAIRCVDQVIPEESWDQKASDIKRYNVQVLGMGDDWIGKFDDLKEYCDVVYLPRTLGISSTRIKSLIGGLSFEHIRKIEDSAKEIANIFKTFGIDEA